MFKAKTRKTTKTKKEKQQLSQNKISKEKYKTEIGNSINQNLFKTEK